MRRAATRRVVSMVTVAAALAGSTSVAAQPSVTPAPPSATAPQPVPAPRPAKKPAYAAGLSLLCPGCGHMYLGQYATGFATLGLSASLFVSGAVMLSDAEAPAVAGEPFATDRDDPIGLVLVAGAQNVWFYSVFDAYREARLAIDNRGYDIPMTDETLGDLVSAPFRPSVLSSPWVWAGVPLALGAGIGLLSLVGEDVAGSRTLFDGGGVNFLGEQFSTGVGFGLGEVYYGSLFLPVGVGEEALFRGFVQPALSEPLGRWGGWAGASVLFGAAHIPNFTGPDTDLSTAAVAIPFLTAVGATFGLASMNTGYRLETSVAMHFWYDFLLGTMSFIADPDSQPFVVNFETRL